MPERINWDQVLVRAAQIVRSYDTGVTLRQLFYRLVSEQLIPNRQTAYNTLSSKTAAARRAGWFPDLVDRGRQIQRHRSFAGPVDALRWLRSIYRRDRTTGQPWTIFVGVEKNGLLNLLVNWYGDLGLPVVALGGYSSQTFVDDIRADVERQNRPAILIYAGDFDASGEDILRDFVDRTHCWTHVVRIALNPDQITRYNLPPLPGKSTDSRASGFVERHGELIQVELDALPPDVLKNLYDTTIARWWNDSLYQQVVAREEIDLEKLGGRTK